ncbi:MAG: secretin N-terminal domain-containing protein [Verrucomicrobia bacterium]|nr:secretin N-terminal domain-containing protein [Verrucomicrobiota bacterium]
MRKLLSFLLAGPVLVAGSPLDRAVPALRLEQAPLPAALRILGRAGQVPIVPDPELAAKVTVDLPPASLREALVAVTAPLGLYFEETGKVIAVHRLKTVLYPVDYPQLTRSGSGSASITLGGANGGNVNGNQALPAGTQVQNQGTNGSGTGSDATQVSIQQENQNTFWTTLEAELKAMLKDGDGLVLNRFSGVAQVTAPVSRHEAVRAFLELVNRRITQQVEIEARLVEVTLHDEQKLGIDWDLATTSLGRQIAGKAGTGVDVAGVGGTLLAGNTFTASLGIGRAGAVINALKQQGDLRTVAQPRLRALNNQTAFIKVGEDRPFFRLQQSTSFSTGGTANPVNQTQENYSISTITIGTILAVTPQVDGNGVITLDVLPAITRLQAIVTSPDGKQTAPVTEVKQASTIVRLRDGETAVIGGLISEDAGSTGRSVPGLGAVPLLGKAFRSEARLRNRTELVIFLTPRVVRS